MNQNTKKLNKVLDFIAGSWRGELGKIAPKNEKIAHKEEVEDKLLANWHKDD